MELPWEIIHDLGNVVWACEPVDHSYIKGVRIEASSLCGVYKCFSSCNLEATINSYRGNEPPAVCGKMFKHAKLVSALGYTLEYHYLFPFDNPLTDKIDHVLVIFVLKKYF